MARYIDAEQFEKRLMELFMEPRYMHDEDNYYTAMSIAIDEIRHAPTADVTQITKCENCAYYHPEKGGWCERHDFEFDVGDFCCHGTPRGGR